MLPAFALSNYWIVQTPEKCEFSIFQTDVSGPEGNFIGSPFFYAFFDTNSLEHSPSFLKRAVLLISGFSVYLNNYNVSNIITNSSSIRNLI